MAPPTNENLSKEDLFLLLESYKNSVEMNTIISQQLTNILEILQASKDENTILESNLKEKMEGAISVCDKIRDKMEGHNTESIKSLSKLMNRVNLLYVAIGSIVLSLVVLIIQLIDKFGVIKAIALKLGV